MKNLVVAMKTRWSLEPKNRRWRGSRPGQKVDDISLFVVVVVVVQHLKKKRKRTKSRR